MNALTSTPDATTSPLWNFFHPRLLSRKFASPHRSTLDAGPRTNLGRQVSIQLCTTISSAFLQSTANMSNDSHSQNHGEPAHAHSGTHHHTTPTGHSSSSSRQSNESLYRAFLDYLKEDAVVNVPSHNQTIVTDHHKPYTAATILDEIKEVTHPEQRMHGESVSDVCCSEFLSRQIQGLINHCRRSSLRCVTR